ncbi:hypothetical protein [uncultured Vagococcus sp.]|uniref:hypothetical protein n=1 Tax=uncultured Vagococcus sp. TaxID=189676 RepID=UPI0028D6A258|nr:hypothetical protein [uncultured Vagococcus sp.]
MPPMKNGKVVLTDGLTDGFYYTVKEHPTYKGIFEVNYNVAAMNNKLEFLPGVLKKIDDPKTVYDASIDGDKLSDKAAKVLQTEGKVVAGKDNMIEAMVDEVTFFGYLEKDVSGNITDIIKNFYPVLNGEL